MENNFTTHAFTDATQKAFSQLMYSFTVTAEELAALLDQDPKENPSYEKPSPETSKENTCRVSFVDSQNNDGIFEIQKDLYALFATLGHLATQQHHNTQLSISDGLSRPVVSKFYPSTFPVEPTPFKVCAISFYSGMMAMTGWERLDPPDQPFTINVASIAPSAAQLH